MPVDDVTEADVLRFVAERVTSRAPAQIATVNAEYVMRARRDPEFRAVIEGAELRTADGAGVVMAGRKRGLVLRRRVGGSDLIWSISEQAARLGHHLFLLGGAKGVAELVAQRLKERYPGLEVAGTHSGTPLPTEDKAQMRLIREAAPDVLLVAFGAPGQDVWISRMKLVLGVPVIMGVGGAFDYVAGVARQPPRWMGTVGADWLFRLIHQPWRWRRMLVLPEFAILAAMRRD